MQGRVYTLLLAGMVLVLSAGFLPRGAAAWTNANWGGTWNNPSSSLLQTMIMNRAMRNASVQGNSQVKTQPGSVANKKPSAATVGAGGTAATFRPVAAKLMTKQTAEAFSKDPKERKELEQVFGQLLDIFADDAKKDGEANNLARAAAFFVVAHYTVISGSVPPENLAVAYQRSLAAELAENQEFRTLSDRKKQELYETFVIYGMFALSGYKQSIDEGKRQQAETYRTFSGQCIETVLGVAADRLRFTNAGLSIVN